MSIFNELKRRNVFKVATAYLVVGWLILQVFGSVAEPLGFPAWVHSFIIVVIALGLPIALIFAWAFELTPEGIKKSSDVDGDSVSTKNTSRKIDFVIIGALVLIIGGLIYKGSFTTPYVEQEEAVMQAENKSVAVLPFVDMSPNKDQEWFSDGLTEEILNSLAMLPELQVTARTSAFHFKGQNIPITEIAQKLGVAHVVEGSVRRAGDMLRITAQLIRASDGFHLWSETYDRPVADVFNVQQDVAENIAETLDVFLDQDRRDKMMSTGTRNVQAFDLYLKAQKLFSRVHEGNAPESLWDVNILFDQAIQLDPTYSAAYYQKIDAYTHFLIDGPMSNYVKGGHEKNLDNQSAYAMLMQLYDKSIALAKTEPEKIIYDFERTALSDDWSRLPALMRAIKKDFDGVARAKLTWIYNIMNVLGEGDFIREFVVLDHKYNPLSPAVWSSVISAERNRQGNEAALDKIQEARDYGMHHQWIEDEEVYTYILSDNQAGLEKMLQSPLLQKSSVKALILAALGRIAEAQQLIDIIFDANAHEQEFIWAYHLMGEQEQANAIARKIDAHPLAIIPIGFLLSENKGIIPVTIDQMPNFTRKLRQAGLADDKINAMFLPN